MRNVTRVFGAVLIAGAVCACNLLPFLPTSVDEPEALPAATSPATPDTEFTTPAEEPKQSTGGFPSPTIEIPPPVD